MKLVGNLVFLLLATAMANTRAAASEFAGNPEIHQPGYQSIEVAAEHHTAPFSGVVFYPARNDGKSVILGENAVFQGVAARQNASAARGRFPVVLLSHGLGGHTGTLAWLSAGLARRGVIVVAVNHPHSTTRDFDMQK
jgi:predicted dienelactone hydrolase